MRRRRHERGFKLAALGRMEGAADVRALASELGIGAGLLYKWQAAFRRGGAAALRLPGERAAAREADAEAAVSGGASDATDPPAPAVARPSDVAALERKVARQALELDFFRAALRHFAARRRTTDGSGETGSMP